MNEEMEIEPNYPNTNKNGNNSVTEEEIADALRKCRGLQYLTAELLDRDPSTICERIKKSPFLQQVRLECKEKRKDRYEQILDKLAEKEELGAICFFLKTQAKDRGYTESSNEKEIPVEVLMKYDAMMQQIRKYQESKQSPQ